MRTHISPLKVSVYFIADADTARRHSIILPHVVERACKAGVDIVQYRDKSVSDEEFLKIALELRNITARYNVPLLLNDRVWLVEKVGADGVHVGQEDTPCNEVRQLLGSEAIVGITTKTPQEAKQAEQDGATYVAASNIFPTITKPNLPPPAGVERIRKIRQAVSIPVVAVAGITDADKAFEAVRAGADGVAVVRAILLAEDVEKAVQELTQAVERGRRAREFGYD